MDFSNEADYDSLSLPSQPFNLPKSGDNASSKLISSAEDIVSKPVTPPAQQQQQSPTAIDATSKNKTRETVKDNIVIATLEAAEGKPLDPSSANSIDVLKEEVFGTSDSNEIEAREEDAFGASNTSSNDDLEEDALVTSKASSFDAPKEEFSTESPDLINTQRDLPIDTASEKSEDELLDASRERRDGTRKEVPLKQQVEQWESRIDHGNVPSSAITDITHRLPKVVKPDQEDRISASDTESLAKTSAQDLSVASRNRITDGSLHMIDSVAFSSGQQRNGNELQSAVIKSWLKLMSVMLTVLFLGVLLVFAFQGIRYYLLWRTNDYIVDIQGKNKEALEKEMETAIQLLNNLKHKELTAVKEKNNVALTTLKQRELDLHKELGDYHRDLEKMIYKKRKRFEGNVRKTFSRHKQLLVLAQGSGDPQRMAEELAEFQKVYSRGGLNFADSFNTKVEKGKDIGDLLNKGGYQLTEVSLEDKRMPPVDYNQIFWQAFSTAAPLLAFVMIVLYYTVPSRCRSSVQSLLHHPM